MDASEREKPQSGPVFKVYDKATAWRAFYSRVTKPLRRTILKPYAKLQRGVILKPYAKL